MRLTGNQENLSNRFHLVALGWRQSDLPSHLLPIFYRGGLSPHSNPRQKRSLHASGGGVQTPLGNRLNAAARIVRSNRACSIRRYVTIAGGAFA